MALGVLDAASPQAQPSTVSFPAGIAQYSAVVSQYCVSCHNERLKAGGLGLDQLDLGQVPQHPDVWEKVVHKLRTGMMPPIGSKRPDQATYDSFAAYLETALDRSAASSPYPGRPLLHRLNRAEYANAIRDLLALDVDTATLLPPDDSSFGFDNIADVLGVSPALQERYLSAARQISALAVGDPAIGSVAETYQAKEDLTQTQHFEGMPLGTRGGLIVKKTFPLDGEYEISAKIFRTNEGNIRGMQFTHQFLIVVDDEQVFEDTVGGARDSVGRGDPQAMALQANATLVGDAIDARWRARIPVKAGPHTIAVTFRKRSEAAPPDVLKPFFSTFDHIETQGVPQIQSMRIAGPFSATGPGDTPSRQRIFVCRPTRATEEESCARTILSALARRAYRRPVTDDDMTELLSFYTAGRKQGSFDQGIQMALRFLLSTPEFAFRAERDPSSVAPGGTYRVNDFELASRLSYFLWSSIPDDQLLDVAAQGRLRNQSVLAQQVRRMLADPKAKALTDNFAGQWLYTRNLRTFSPVLDIFPDFDDNLRQAMKTETEMFFESIIQEDRSVLDLLTADYTFVNERLAKHYSIANIYGSHFRRVTLTDDARRGLLGKGSILAVTSRADRTSPVLRGKWVLENLMSSPPPPPPPNVPPLKETEGERPKTLKAQMELHRANPVCASCHKMMDPVGFALENFDATGAWRSQQDGNAIDASGELWDGAKVDGVKALRDRLLRRPDVFVNTMTEKMLTYALGRGLDYHDMPAIRTIVRDAAKNNYRFSSIVLGIINSTPFQMRMKTPQEPVATSAARH